MIKQLLILFALVAFATAGGSVLAQTATTTTTPSPTPTTAAMPKAAPNTGFGPLR